MNWFVIYSNNKSLHLICGILYYNKDYTKNRNLSTHYRSTCKIDNSKGLIDS